MSSAEGEDEPVPFGADVIPLPIGDWQRQQNQADDQLEGLPVRPAPTNFRACSHQQTWVDVRARTVTCRDCGVAVDPIDVLHALAQEHERVYREIRRATHAKKRLLESVARLERDERNAKARVRAARKRAVRFDGDAVRDAVSAVWSDRDFEGLPVEQQERILAQALPLIETYVARLTAADDAPVDASRSRR